MVGTHGEASLISHSIIANLILMVHRRMGMQLNSNPQKPPRTLKIQRSCACLPRLLHPKSPTTINLLPPEHGRSTHGLVSSIPAIHLRTPSRPNTHHPTSNRLLLQLRSLALLSTNPHVEPAFRKSLLQPSAKSTTSLRTTRRNSQFSNTVPVTTVS